MSKTPAPKTPSKKLTDNANLPAATLEERVEQSIVDIVPQRQLAQIVDRLTTVIASEAFSGPIAHPRHLEAYERTCPGAADRIIRMAEERSQHNMRMEEAVVNASNADLRRGMIFGLVGFLALVSAATMLALLGIDWKIITAFLGAAAVGVVGKFISGRAPNGK